MRYSTPFVIREIKIKTRMTYPYRRIRRAKTKKPDNSKWWWGRGATGTRTHRWQKRKTLQPLWKTVGQFLITLNMSLPDPAIPLRETIMYVHAKNVHSSSTCKGNTGTTQRSTSRWLDKQVVTHPHSGIQLSNKKKRTTNTRNVDASQNVDESQNRFMLSGRSQTQKDYMLCDSIYIQL